MYFILTISLIWVYGFTSVFIAQFPRFFYAYFISDTTCRTGD